MACKNNQSNIIEKKTKRNCCVVNCNSKGRKDIKLHFYSFPNRPRESERKKQWIQAVRRNTLSGEFWQPTPNSRICSLHFRGGVKSNIQSHESYNPTEFSIIDEKQKKLLNSKRTKNAMVVIPKLKNKETNEDLLNDNNHGNTENCMTENIKITFNNFFKSYQYTEIGVQTDSIIDEGVHENNDSSIFYCYQNTSTNEVSTQTSIMLTSRTINKLSVPLLKETKSICIGTDTPSKIGFLGYEDIKDDKTMKQFGGITLSFFHILLQFIQPKTRGQPAYYKTLNAQNRLLLFLMKMKLGLSFSAVGCFFKISKTTASTIFHEILHTLFERTKTWIFWPSKDEIKKKIPGTFRNYPNCRAIIDCTELRCDTPSTVKQKHEMYSSCKAGFTIKYLKAISPSGIITFISKGYGGRSTDDFIVNDSGFINIIESGDEIMANKEFPQIKTALLKQKCVLIMPPSVTNSQLIQDELQQYYLKSSVKNHVERAIQRVYIYQILQHINVELFEYIDKIMHVACVLVNNKEPLLSTEDE